MKSHRTWVWSLLSAACCGSIAHAQTDTGPFGGGSAFETFDNCPNGPITTGPPSTAIPCNGWQQWDSAPNTTSIINTDIARSGTKSVSVDSVGGPTSDLLHVLPGAETGQQIVRAFQYVPGPGAVAPLSPAVDKLYFIVMNTYADFGPYDWSVQVTMNPITASWSIDTNVANFATGPLVFDRWVELKVAIDLTNDLTFVYYDGVLISNPAGYSWTGGVFGGGTGVLDIAAVDMYHAPATVSPSGKGYWDDIALLPGPMPPMPASNGCPGKFNCGTPTSPGGCVPTMFIGGPAYASASLTSGFVIGANGALAGKVCLLFYGSTGPANTPFRGGTLCVNGPIRRTGARTATPATGICQNASVSIDMNAFAHQSVAPIPAPYLSVQGTVVDCQWWGRDPGCAPPNQCQLSDGLEYTVGP